MENEPRLRIKPLPLPPEKQKISFRLPAPTLATFNSYLAAYKEIYGVEPDADFVADQIFTNFFESDRAFAAYMKKAAEAHPEKASEAENPAKKGKAILGGDNATLGESAQI